MPNDPHRTTPALTAGSPLPLAQKRPEPEQLAQYRIVKLLGQGGMGQVYRAEDQQLRRPVALKVMRPEIASDDMARARFVQEARAAAALKHEHIVTIYQVGEDRGMPFLAMEFLEGKSLDEWLRPDRRATVHQTVVIGKQILKGLEAAHAAGLIHRDIKPANIWLEAPRSRVKILDFGLARLRAVEFTALTEDGAVLGTPAFMAPEQARGEAVDPRCDLFSFGCVLYRMVTGRLPFQGTNYLAVLTSLALETPTPVRQINADVPPRLAELIERLLAKKADDRPASAAAALAQLLEIEKEVKPGPAPHINQQQETAATRPTSDLARRPRRWQLAVAGLATVAALALLAVQYWPSDHQPAATATVPAAATQAPAEIVKMTDLVDIERDVVSGKWSRFAGGLHGQAEAEGEAYLVLRWIPPPAYRLRLRMTRLRDETGPASIGLATDRENKFEFLLDLPYRNRDGFASGIPSVEPAPLANQSQLWKSKVMPIGQPVLVICTVEPGILRVTVDDKLIFNETGDLKALKRRRTEAPAAPLFLGSFRGGSYKFQDIVLEPLSGQRGRPLERRPPPAP